MPALVVLEEGVERLLATIVNISESGAKLELPTPVKLPENFYMLMPEHRIQPCRLVWSDHHYFGVSYVG